MFKTFNAQFTCDMIKMNSELTICIQKQDGKENQHRHWNLTDLTMNLGSGLPLAQWPGEFVGKADSFAVVART